MLVLPYHRYLIDGHVCAVCVLPLHSTAWPEWLVHCKLGTTHPLPLTARPVSQRADHSDETMQDLFNAGYKKDQVLDALRQLPVHPAMKRAVTNLKNRGETTFLCLSNSNEVYIGTILEVSTALVEAGLWADGTTAFVSRSLASDVSAYCGFRPDTLLSTPGPHATHIRSGASLTSDRSTA